VRGLAQIIACDIQPINNLRVLHYLKERLGQNQDAIQSWCRNWVTLGLEAFEKRLKERPQPSAFCFGDTPTVADVCLVPQLYNARRIGCDLSGFPLATRIAGRCRDLEAFRRATPERQPDRVDGNGN
jgi:maleylacetoacetate isomerase